MSKTVDWLLCGMLTTDFRYRFPPKIEKPGT